jgi:hypothetical protein
MRADLRWGQMIDLHGWHVAHADKLCRFDSAMSRNYTVGTINENRTDKSEFFDARCNLFDLLCGVRAGIPVSPENVIRADSRNEAESPHHSKRCLGSFTCW